MEGWNPTAGCTLRCSGCHTRGWVPAPKSFYPRRDPLIDAVGRSDDPCERPARCPPCCKPTPKFRPPQEQPPCDLNNYRTEQAQAKWNDAMVEQMSRICCHEEIGDPWRMEVNVLDPTLPVVYQQEDSPPPEAIFHLREQRCRSNLLAGWFNPDDNKSPAQRKREACDPFYRHCGCNLKPYPCRGVIQYPPRRWVSLAEENRSCYPSICEGTKYVTPEYMAKQLEKERRFEAEKLLANQEQEQYGQRQMQNGHQIQQRPRGGCLDGRCGCD